MRPGRNLDHLSAPWGRTCLPPPFMEGLLALPTLLGPPIVSPPSPFPSQALGDRILLSASSAGTDDEPMYLTDEPQEAQRSPTGSPMQSGVIKAGGRAKGKTNYNL